MTYSWYFSLTSWHFSVTSSAADPASACLPPCFPSSKTQTWPVGLVVMMMVETGYLAGGNQSRTQYTMIKFLNPRAKFPLCLLLPLHFSTPMLPLLCFHFPLLSLICDTAETLGLQFLQLSQPSAVYIPFSPVSYPTLQRFISPPSPLLLLLDYSPRLILPWHTLSSQMKETLSDCLVFQRSMIPQKGTLCASLSPSVFSSSFGLYYWRWGNLKRRREQIRSVFVLNRRT